MTEWLSTYPRYINHSLGLNQEHCPQALTFSWIPLNDWHLRSLKGCFFLLFSRQVRLFMTPWTAACQAPSSSTKSWNLLKCMSVESVVLSNHFILCHLLLLLPSIFPSIRVFSNELILRIKWPKYWSFSFSISPSNEYSGLISFRIDWFDLLEVPGTLKSPL